MESLSFLPFMAVSTPESLVLYYMGTALFGYKPSVKKLIAASFVTSLISYVVRLMPIPFGIHTLIELILMIILFWNAFGMSLALSIITTFLAAFLLGLAEGILLPFLGWIFGLSLKQIISDPIFRLIFGMPHLIVLSLATYFTTRNGWHLRVIKKSLVGKTGEERLVHARKFYLFFILLLQALMLVFLNLNFYIYEAGVFPTFKVSYLMVSTSITIIASAITTFFVANRLIKITNREAKLEADLRYISEMQNLNLQMRSQRHDFYNHITSLYGFIRAERYENAKTYMESLYQDIRNVKEFLELDPPALGALLSLKREKADKLGVDFSWEIDLENKVLPLSTQELTQVLGNLLDNSVEAAQRAESKTVKLHMENNSFGFIISVANTSGSIPKEVLDNLFQPGISTKDNGEHSGLGLYIVKQIVDRHKGEIDIGEPEGFPGLEIHVFIPQKSAS